MKAYWFSKMNGATEYQRVPAAIGCTDTCTGKIVPCKNGLHGSLTPWDGLSYETGPLMWEVELSGEVVPHGFPIDKYAARKRKYLRCVDLSDMMRRFAAQQALSVIHLWKAPDAAKTYLQSVVDGHERVDLRSIAVDAAWSTFWAAEGSARAAEWFAAKATGSAAISYVVSIAANASRSAAGIAKSDASWSAAINLFNKMAIKALEGSERK